MAYYSGTITLEELIPTLIANMKASGWTEKKVASDNTFYANPASTTNPVSSTTVNAVSYSYQASTFQGSNYVAYAFDNDNLSAGTKWWAANTATGWLRVDYTAAAAKVIARYAIATNGTLLANATYGMPRNWTFEGSNDGTAWTVLDTQTNIDQTKWMSCLGNINGTTNISNNAGRLYFNVTNSTAYRYYRINISAATQGSYVAVAQLELYESDASATAFDYVMTSVGSSGTDKLVLGIYQDNFSPHHLYAVTVNRFTLVLAEDVDYNTPAWYKGKILPFVYYTASTNTATVNDKRTPITYFMNITKDSVILATSLDPAAASTANNIMYVGLMKRHSVEPDSGAMLMMTNNYNAYTANPLVLKNKLGNTVDYTSRFLTPGISPSLWGDQVFTSPLFLEGTNEGVRGELENFLIAKNTGIVHEDEVTIGTTKFKAFIGSGTNTQAFPAQATNAYLIKMS